MPVEIERIISGGQTGADRGALDAALGFGMAVGGWVPRGRIDENGTIPRRYPNLVETETADPAERTELNVRSADATLILSQGPLAGGSAFTRECALKLGKPWNHIDLTEGTTSAAVGNILNWLSQVKPGVLNVAGPRASEDPLIYDATKTILERVLMNQNLDALVEVRASVLTQCSHWDQIRWQVPSWFCTLGTVSIAAVAYLHDTATEAKFFAALGIFGGLCFVLLCRLVSYERRLVHEFNHDTLDALLPDGGAMARALEVRRPFDFAGVRILLTATFWFLAYTALLSGIFLGCAAWLWWRHQIWPVIWTIVIAVSFEIVVLWVLPKLVPPRRRLKKASADGEGHAPLSSPQ